jgi:DNA invertase Pin-like site-specific DNA recombinase
MSGTPLRRSGVRSALTPARRRRQVENPEYIAFVRRILRALSRRAGAGDLDALAELARLRDELDGHLADVVTMLRAEPCCYSWQEIAGALGITRQTAQERWRKAGGARRPGGQPGNLR